MKGCGTYELWLRNQGETNIDMTPKFDNKRWLEYAEILRKKQFTTLEIAKLFNMTPSRWCDIREGRVSPLIYEAREMISAMLYME